VPRSSASTRRARSWPARARSSSYKVEGIGYDFIPDVLDRKLVDRWIKSNDRDSFRIARQLIRQEGLLWSAARRARRSGPRMQVARELGAGKRVVTLLPDSIRNYLTKFADDKWMRQQGFLKADWEVGTIADMVRALPKRERHQPRPQRQGRAMRRHLLFKQHGISQLPVLDGGQAGRHPHRVRPPARSW
jgi:cystathionine beta-synthase